MKKMWLTLGGLIMIVTVVIFIANGCGRDAVNPLSSTSTENFHAVTNPVPLALAMPPAGRSTVDLRAIKSLTKEDADGNLIPIDKSAVRVECANGEITITVGNKRVHLIQ